MRVENKHCMCCQFIWKPGRRAHGRERVRETKRIYAEHELTLFIAAAPAGGGGGGRWVCWGGGVGGGWGGGGGGGVVGW
jgi:hypothetical protein